MTMRIERDSVITKSDLETAVFLSQGEVDRYNLILQHDIRTAQLMDEQLASAQTIVMPWSGTFVDPAREWPGTTEMKRTHFAGAALTNDDDVIRHEDDVRGDTGETGTLYDTPVM